VRSRALRHLSSGGCVKRERDAKKRLDFGTEKDCLLVDDFFIIKFSLLRNDSCGFKSVLVVSPPLDFYVAWAHTELSMLLKHI